jgi:hypothetical protein
MKGGGNWRFRALRRAIPHNVDPPGAARAREQNRVVVAWGERNDDAGVAHAFSSRGRGAARAPMKSP